MPETLSFHFYSLATAIKTNIIILTRKSQNIEYAGRYTDRVMQNALFDGDPPPWYAVFRVCLDGTQYAKGPYAVRINSVISYADIVL